MTEFQGAKRIVAPAPVVHLGPRAKLPGLRQVAGVDHVGALLQQVAVGRIALGRGLQQALVLRHLN